MFTVNISTGGSRRARMGIAWAVSVAFVACLCAAACLCLAGSAHASSLQDQLDSAQGKLSKANDKKGVLSSRVEALGDRIDSYERQVSSLRTEERSVKAELAAKQAQLDQAEADVQRAHGHLKVIAARLKRSLEALRARLVAMYQSGNPDLTSVVFSANNFGDLVSRSEYVKQIQDQDELLINRVRDLRDKVKRTVIRLKRAKDTIESARDEIAAREQALADARRSLQAKQGQLRAVKDQRQSALDKIDSHVDHLETIESGIQRKIQEQIMAASGTTPLPAGPMTAPSAAGLIWPVSGPITSGFGGRSSPGGIGSTVHEGIDIAVPIGTPIRAAKGGTVIIAAYTGGYGNYTCIDHGGGLSTCYGHQSGYAVSSGDQVSQGQVIGYSGNTGSSTGPHVHFEVRINGTAVDPMGYL